MKGQYFSFDAIIGSVIFVLALLALLSYWHSVRTYLDYQNADLPREAIRISGLVFTPPSSVDCSKITHLGFAYSWSDKQLNADVLDCATSFKESDLKSYFGTGYNVSIEVKNLKTGASFSIGPGIGSISNAQEVFPIRRRGTVYNSTNDKDYPALIDVYVYR